MIAFPILGMLIKDSEKKDSKGLKILLSFQLVIFLKSASSEAYLPVWDNFWQLKAF